MYVFYKIKWFVDKDSDFDANSGMSKMMLVVENKEKNFGGCKCI